MNTTKKNSLASITKPIKSSKCTGERNTFRIEYEDGSVAYRLHQTDVLVIDSDGYVLNSGGWRTPTTKDRIETYLPISWHISQEKGLWYVSTPKGRFDFHDGMRITTDGSVPDARVIDVKKVDEVKKKIKAFANQITKDNFPEPDSGDCWLCSMRDKNGETMGAMGGKEEDAAHLLNHVEENYLHGSLIMNAMLDAGYRPEQFYLFKSMGGMIGSVRRCVVKYLQKKIIPFMDFDLKVLSEKQKEISMKMSYEMGGRGYGYIARPTFAVAGANDTGTWSDSPCPTDVCEKELDGFKKILSDNGIAYMETVCESDNVFMVRHFIVVSEKDHPKAYELAKEYAKGDTRLFYAEAILRNEKKEAI